MLTCSVEPFPAFLRLLLVKQRRRACSAGWRCSSERPWICPLWSAWLGLDGRASAFQTRCRLRAACGRALCRVGVLGANAADGRLTPYRGGHSSSPRPFLIPHDGPVRLKAIRQQQAMQRAWVCFRLATMDHTRRAQHKRHVAATLRPSGWTGFSVVSPCQTDMSVRTPYVCRGPSVVAGRRTLATAECLLYAGSTGLVHACILPACAVVVEDAG